MLEPKTYLILLHLLGLVVGLGSVTTLDLYLLKFLRGETVTRSDAHLVGLVARCAAVGLLCLWLSGIGFLTLAWLSGAELLGSPKVQAKLLVVGVLTANGALLHYKVLPLVERAVGRPLFCRTGARSDRIWMRACGAVSAASWWTPFVLGAVRELNYAAPVWAFLGAYLVLLGLFGAGFTVVEHYLSSRRLKAPVQEPAIVVTTPSPMDVAPALAAVAAPVARPAMVHPALADRMEAPYRIAGEERSFGFDGGLDRDIDRHLLERRALESRLNALRERLAAWDLDADEADDRGSGARDGGERFGDGRPADPRS